MSSKGVKGAKRPSTSSASNGAASKDKKTVAVTSKAAPVKGKAPAKNLVEAVRQLDDADDDETSATSLSSGEEYEEGQDVSSRGLERLMKALGEDGLDEFDTAALEGMELDGESGEDEEEDEEDDESDEEQESDEEASEANESDEEDQNDEPRANGDSLAASILRSGLVPEEEEEDDDEDDDEEDEDGDEEGHDEELAGSKPKKRNANVPDPDRPRVNHTDALRRVYEGFRLAGPPVDLGTGQKPQPSLPWIEHMSVTHDEALDIQDPENDLQRELAFYKQSLRAAIVGRQRYEAAGQPFTRPADFFAEMVKSDEHMERVRQRLLDERAGIKASEEAKRQRELKKFGKKVQVEKGLERQKEKKRIEESIRGLKRKRQGNQVGDADVEDAFDVQLATALDGVGGTGPSRDSSSSRGRRGRGRGVDGKAKMPRTARDDRFGFGGKKRHAKENTAASTNDFGGPSKRGRGGARGGRGGRGGGGRGRGGSRGASSRPGKSKRSAGRG